MSREAIPDAWPPPAGDPVVVPLFPLRGVFLLPRQVLPLHVFEPRYRQLVEDVLDRSGRLVLGTITTPGAGPVDTEATPPVLPVAGLGEIARHEKTPDGRYFIWLFGLGRHAVEEADSDRLYRRVRAQPVTELEPTAAESRELTPRLRKALEERHDGALELPPDLPVSLLTDGLSAKLHLPQAAMEPIFCELDVARRARLVLEAHDTFRSPS